MKVSGPPEDVSHVTLTLIIETGGSRLLQATITFTFEKKLSLRV